MKYATACSGICSLSAAVSGKNTWEPQWFSEIKKPAIKVLAHHYPNTPNLGDMTKIHEQEIYKQSDIDVFFAGTPCQSFSTSGLRKGMDDPRGNLTLHTIRILDETRPFWFLWENVPGVLSSTTRWKQEGDKEERWYSDFHTFIAGLTEIGYGVAYRIFDAQYFGVAQIRRRVFLVGCLGGWTGASAVLFDSASLRRNPAPSRKKGQSTSGQAGNGVEKGCFWNEEQVVNTITAKGADGDQRMPDKGNFMAILENNDRTWPAEVAGTIDATYADKLGQNNQHIDNGATLFVMDKAAQMSGKNQTGGIFIKESELSPTIVTDGVPAIVSVYDTTQITSPINQSKGKDEVCHTIAANQHPPLIVSENVQTKHNDIPRRLTPLEVERLFGFPDNYTKVKGVSDTARYDLLGNSVCVPALKWISERIEFVDSVLRPEKHQQQQ